MDWFVSHVAGCIAVIYGVFSAGLLGYGIVKRDRYAIGGGAYLAFCATVAAWLQSLFPHYR